MREGDSARPSNSRLWNGARDRQTTELALFPGLIALQRQKSCFVVPNRNSRCGQGKLVITYGSHPLAATRITLTCQPLDAVHLSQTLNSASQAVSHSTVRYRRQLMKANECSNINSLCGVYDLAIGAARSWNPAAGRACCTALSRFRDYHGNVMPDGKMIL